MQAGQLGGGTSGEWLGSDVIVDVNSSVVLGRLIKVVWIKRISL